MNTEANQRINKTPLFFLISCLADEMDDDESQWKDDFKVRFSSDFDRLVAFATEMNKQPRGERDASPKREMEPSPMSGYHNDYRPHIKKDESRKMKSEKNNHDDYPADLSPSKRLIRMMMEEHQHRGGKHYD